MIIELILYIFALITVIPVGLLLAWLCDDELIYPRKYFRFMIIVLGVGTLGCLIFYRNISVILSMVYMILIFFVMLWKGKAILKKKR